MGYTLAMIIYSIATYGITFGIVPSVCLYIGPCELFIALINDITNDVIALNGLGKISHHRKMREIFVGIVDSSSKVKQLSTTLVYFEI